MTTTHRGRALRAALLLTLSWAALASSASAADQQHERLVVRGTDTVAEGPCGPSGCELRMTDGSFRGTLGTGGYAGKVRLQVADAFPNGEDGLCAPVRGRMVLGTGTPHRLAIAFAGDSCQDGKGPVTTASFTGLAHFVVTGGTRRYAHARGHGTAAFLEGADDRERVTLIGRIAR